MPHGNLTNFFYGLSLISSAIKVNTLALRYHLPQQTLKETTDTDA